MFGALDSHPLSPPPLLGVNHELRPGFAGNGEWRRGLGAVCEVIHKDKGDALLNTAGDGAAMPPFSVLGWSAWSPA